MLDEELKTFIQGSIPSVWALEVLLLMRRDPTRTWSPDDLARELRATGPLIHQQMGSLQTAGLLVCSEGCRYSPAAAALDRLCQQLEEAYRERPGQVIKVIMAQPNDKLQIFADAFRFRGEDK